MKSILNIVLAAALATTLVSCGESKKEQAERESAEYDRQLIREYQRNENIQRQADRDQQAIETGVQILDVLTR